MNSNFEQVYKLRFFLVIFILTIFHGFYNSILFAYGFSEWPDISFLFDPDDLHADLIKVGLAYIPLSFDLPVETWLPQYKEYFLNNPYRNENFLGNGYLKIGGMPLTTGIYLLIKSLIIKFSPSFVVLIFYLFFYLSCTLIFFNVLRSVRYALSVSILMSFSYVPIFILTRGHVVSAIVGLLIILICVIVGRNFRNLKDHNPLLLMALIALLINLKINCIIFLALFFLFGFRKGLIIIFGTIFLSMVLFILIGSFIVHLHEAWNFGNIFIVLSDHFTNYVHNNNNLLFNNSLISFLKSICYIFDLEIQNDQISFATMISLSMLFIIGITVIFYKLNNKINFIEFIFSIFSIYILATPTFHINYMFGLYAIIFLHIFDKKMFHKCRYIIYITIFLLIPKHYFSYYLFESSFEISMESLLNPLVLIIFLLYMVLRSTNLAKLKRS